MGECQPHPLGDLTWIRYPCLELDVAGVCWLDEVRDDAFQGALVPDDLWRPGMGQDAIQAVAHPVEDTEAECVRQATLGVEADVDSSPGEATSVSGLDGVGSVLEPDQVRFRLVKHDGDIPFLSWSLSTSSSEMSCAPALCGRCRAYGTRAQDSQPRASHSRSKELGINTVSMSG